jgi:hypothetical protein
MDWMLIASSTLFFALCALCAYVVNAPSEPAAK